LELVLGGIQENDAHADSLVHVDHLAIGGEGVVIAGDDYIQEGVERKSAGGY
jgi:hypothetical protein